MVIKVHEANTRGSKEDDSFPNPDHVKSRMKEGELEETVVAPVVTSGKYEDYIHSYNNSEATDEEIKSEEMKVIDNQMSIYASNMYKLIKSNYKISENTKKKVIHDLKKVIEELTKEK